MIRTNKWLRIAFGCFGCILFFAVFLESVYAFEAKLPGIDFHVLIVSNYAKDPERDRKAGGLPGFEGPTCGRDEFHL